MSDLSDNIETAATQPASTTIDGTTIQNRPLADQVEADKYVNEKKTLKKRGLGLVFRKIRRGSALGE